MRRNGRRSKQRCRSGRTSRPRSRRCRRTLTARTPSGSGTPGRDCRPGRRRPVAPNRAQVHLAATQYTEQLKIASKRAPVSPRSAPEQRVTHSTQRVGGGSGARSARNISQDHVEVIARSLYHVAVTDEWIDVAVRERARVAVLDRVGVRHSDRQCLKTRMTSQA